VLKERGADGLERIEFAKGPPEIGELFTDGQEVIPQRQAGFNTVRLMILRSELTSAQCRQIAAWARRCGDGSLMFTARQNVQIRFVPDAQVEALVREIHDAGYVTEGHERLPDMVACVGTTQCNLAVSDTPNTYRRLYAELASDKALWQQVGQLRIHMNGCPNSCAQHWIADIGLRGMRKEMATGSEEGFTICVGGGLSGPGHIAQPVCDVPATEVVPYRAQAAGNLRGPACRSAGDVRRVRAPHRAAPPCGPDRGGARAGGAGERAQPAPATDV
jgi:sulfite reductase beta subunit-like hemoprotein